jgi:RNA polymerase sigma factor (sigma-70 family)
MAMSADFGLASEDKPRRDAQVIIELITRARDGDRQAWDALVDRYAPLIWAICRRYRLDQADAENVAQIIWLRLLEQLEKIPDRAALAGWLATAAQRECIRVLRTRRPQQAWYVPDAGDVPDDQSGTAQQELLAAERDAALREALARLPAYCQRLIALLCADPPVPYAEISTRLGIAIGNIGPYRGRCLEKLRRDPAIAALIRADPGPRDGGPRAPVADRTRPE